MKERTLFLFNLGWHGMKLPARILLLVALVVVGGSLLPALPAASRAAPAPPGPDRYKKVVVPYVAFTWWLSEWGSNKIVCEIVIDYEGTPHPDAIYKNCGGDTYNTWIKTAPCPQDTINNDPADCTGYYLQFVSSESREKTISSSMT